MKATWLIAVAVVISSYLGARHAVERRLRSPEQAPRVVSVLMRQQVADSVRAKEAYAGMLARNRAAIRHRERMNMLCAKDWEMASTAKERADVLAGWGPLTYAETGYSDHGICVLNNEGAIVWEGP